MEECHSFSSCLKASPEDLPKLALEMTAGGVEVIQVGQDAALRGGAVRRVHARLHHDTQPVSQSVPGETSQHNNHHDEEQQQLSKRKST